MTLVFVKKQRLTRLLGQAQCVEFAVAPADDDFSNSCSLVTARVLVLSLPTDDPCSDRSCTVALAGRFHAHSYRHRLLSSNAPLELLLCLCITYTDLNNLHLGTVHVHSRGMDILDSGKKSVTNLKFKIWKMPKQEYIDFLSGTSYSRLKICKNEKFIQINFWVRYILLKFR